MLQPHQMQQQSPNCINYFLWLWSWRCYIFLRRCICKSLWLLSVNSVNVFKSFCIFALAFWPSLQCLESVGRTLGSLDTPTWSIQNILELLGLLKWKESLCKLSFCWSDGYCDWLCFSHLSLYFIFKNQICFTVRRNLTTYYCILRNKPTRPSIQGNFIFAIGAIIEESYFQCKTLSKTSPWYEPWSTIYNPL